MYVSAGILVYDPSGISDMRKRGRGKCHTSCPKGTPSERRAKWIRIQLSSYSKSMVELLEMGDMLLKLETTHGETITCLMIGTPRILWKNQIDDSSIMSMTQAGFIDRERSNNVLRILQPCQRPFL